MTPIVAEPVVDEDQRLVAAVRRGDDRAFEALYSRYQRRIHAYVMGMVKDHGRAEDVTQEVFVSALRRMRETERPIAFKPWIYEIAKNACIDQFRRSKRAEEVSLRGRRRPRPDRLRAARRLRSGARTTPSRPSRSSTTSAARSAACRDTHHEILVLRELEGLSYREIGDRMGMSRPAVESTLFRARRRLTEEYDDLVSGARCHADPGPDRHGRGRPARHARVAPARPPRRRTASRAGARRWLPVSSRDPHARPAAQARRGEGRRPAAVPAVRALPRQRRHARADAVGGPLRRLGQVGNGGGGRRGRRRRRGRRDRDRAPRRLGRDAQARGGHLDRRHLEGQGRRGDRHGPAHGRSHNEGGRRYGQEDRAEEVRVDRRLGLEPGGRRFRRPGRSPSGPAAPAQAPRAAAPRCRRSRSRAAPAILPRPSSRSSIRSPNPSRRSSTA